LLAFLNPADQTVFSKNFRINPNGTAVSCLKVTVIACALTICANLLPTPFRFAFDDMKDNAKRMSAYVAKNFISSVDYYKGAKASVLIEKQMESTVKVEEEIGKSGASISGAFFECFDIGTRGTVRHLHEAHKSLMGELLDITKALEIAIKTEDFAESHLNCMSHIGDATRKLAHSAGAAYFSYGVGPKDGLCYSESAPDDDCGGSFYAAYSDFYKLLDTFGATTNATNATAADEDGATTVSSSA